MADTISGTPQADLEHATEQGVPPHSLIWQRLALVKNGTVRFFPLHATQGQLPPQILNQIPQQYMSLLQGANGPGGGPQAALSSWVKQHCKAVPANVWQSSSVSSNTGSGFGPAGSGNQLYDCVVARRHTNEP